MPITLNGTTGVVTPGATVGSITGILKATSGVVSQAVGGTDYLVGGGSAIPSTNTAKAWVNFNGTLASPITPRASYNVSSVTKNGTGDYTVNFTTAMADANYAACVSFGDLSNNGTACATNIGYSISATSIRIRNMNVTTVVPQDGDQNYVVVFGN